MENMVKVYSCNNVEAMVSSVKANIDIINNMLQYTKNNDKEINNRLSEYAKVKKNLKNDQIDMYRNYIIQKQSIEDAINEYNERINSENSFHQMSIELHNIDSDYSVLHKLFEEINRIQVKVMEMLCGLLGQSNALLGCL